MNLKIREFIISIIYVSMVSWIYIHEIIPYWAYSGFRGTFSIAGLASCMAASGIASFFIPHSRDTRMALLVILHYLFFIPTIIYVSYTNPQIDRIASVFILWACVVFFSGIKMKVFVLAEISSKNFAAVAFSSIALAVFIQIAFGGLRYFNLDIERVYEFRKNAASNLPLIFQYIYSNVTSVLIPITLIISVKLRSYWLLAFTVFCCILIFGMTSHKTVLFGPLISLVIYIYMSRNKGINNVGAFLLAIPLVCLGEIAWLNILSDHHGAGYINSLIMRRTLLVPAMLDSLYVEFFSSNVKYYWSYSRLASWVVENPYSLLPPFVIGQRYFSDIYTAANTGVIGTGYANAGLIGVTFYSILSGLFISLLNAYGTRIGHAMVTAFSIYLVFIVITTTDFLTAILSHGLFLLIVILSVFPRHIVARKTKTE